MVQTRYAPDRGLQARMGLTMFVLGLVFVALVVALVFILQAFGVGSGAIIFFAVLLGGGMAFGSLFWSDKIALRASGAREVTPQEAPQLHGIIDRLCGLADMPKPRVAIAESDMPNAFATGRNSKNAVVCVTTGLLRRLDDKEPEGVIAHEMSPVAHQDGVVMTLGPCLGVIGGLRADQGERRDVRHPHPGPARGAGAERVLLRTGTQGRPGEPVHDVLHPPVAGAAAAPVVRDLRAARPVAGGLPGHPAGPDKAG